MKIIYLKSQKDFRKVFKKTDMKNTELGEILSLVSLFFNKYSNNYKYYTWKITECYAVKDSSSIKLVLTISNIALTFGSEKFKIELDGITCNFNDPNFQQLWKQYIINSQPNQNQNELGR